MSHLVLSHIPPVGVAFCLLLFVFGVILRSVLVQRWARFFVFLTMLFTLWAHLTGPGLEDIARKSYPQAGDLITAHAEAAGTAFVIMMGTGIICFFGLLRGGSIRRLARWYQMIVSLMLIITLALLIGTAGIGIRISRPWLQDQAAVTAPVEPAEVSDSL